MKRIFALSSLCMAGLLGGCAVAPAPYGYGYYGGGYEPAPRRVQYYESAPPAYAPAPYYAPPITLDLGFGYWGGGYGWHHHGYR